MSHDYQERLDYLYGRLNYERLGMPVLASELKLGRMRRLLKKLGDPQAGATIIHVAGTKGKGSTAAMAAACLTAAGIRTGLFSSPHLHRLEERFAVDGAAAAPERIVELVDQVRAAEGRLEQDARGRTAEGATFFELTTAMGLLHFASLGARVIVLEVGMGGRLDSTNVVRPALEVVTNISLDHTRQLGDDLASIARERGGILKRGRPAVLGARAPEARRVLRAIAAARGAAAREIDVDFHVESIPPAPPLLGPTRGRARSETWRRDWGELELPLLGSHQAENAAIALAALDQLAELEPDLEVAREHVVRAFSRLEWPARVEIAGSRPTLVIDGAHNAASAAALAETLCLFFPPSRRILVFGTSREKDVAGQLRALLPLFDRVIATRYQHNPRADAAETVAEIAALLGRRAEVIPDPAAALEHARAAAGPGDLICVTGSLFLAAEIRAMVVPGVAPPLGAAQLSL